MKPTLEWELAVWAHHDAQPDPLSLATRRADRLQNERDLLLDAAYRTVDVLCRCRSLIADEWSGTSTFEEKMLPIDGAIAELKQLTGQQP